MQLFVKKLSETAHLPTKSNLSDAGYDLYADENVIIYPGETVKVKTGIAIAFPQIVHSGFETVGGLIWDRSGLGSKGIHRLAGVVDFGYRGEILVCLTNLNILPILEDLALNFKHSEPSIIYDNFQEALEKNAYRISAGDRIGQLLPQKILKVEVIEVDILEESERNDAGFGSTGK